MWLSPLICSYDIFYFLQGRQLLWLLIHFSTPQVPSEKCLLYKGSKFFPFRVDHLFRSLQKQLDDLPPLKLYHFSLRNYFLAGSQFVWFQCKKVSVNKHGLLDIPPQAKCCGWTEGQTMKTIHPPTPPLPCPPQNKVCEGGVYHFPHKQTAQMDGWIDGWMDRWKDNGKTSRPQTQFWGITNLPDTSLHRCHLCYNPD